MSESIGLSDVSDIYGHLTLRPKAPDSDDSDVSDIHMNVAHLR